MAWLRKTARLFIRSDEGAIAILFALTAMIAAGVIGGAVDFGLAFNERLKLQASVDGAAIAGARAIALGKGDPAQAALASFGSNYAGPTPTVTVGGNQVSVSASVSMPTFFLPLMNLPTLDIAADARAEPAFETVTTQSTGGGNVCVLLLDTFLVDALDVGSAATTVVAPDCEVHVKSVRTNQAASFHTNGTFDVAKSCIEGSYDNSKGANHGVIGPIEAGCATVDDPYAGTLPIPSMGACKSTRNLKNSTEHMTPGTYCGLWHFKGGVDTIDMAPGVYVLKNSVWKFNGLMKGSDVTIYFTGSNSYLNTNGQGTIDIQAPTSGTYKGLLLYEDHTISTLSSMHINGGQQAIVSGLIYLPSRDMKWNGNSGVEADSLTLVANSLEVTGTTTWRFAPFETFGMTAVGTGGTTEQVLLSIKLMAN